jgi:hypothetical protein
MKGTLFIRNTDLWLPRRATEDFLGVAGATISKPLFEAPFEVEMWEDRGGDWSNHLSPVEAPLGKVWLLQNACSEKSFTSPEKLAAAEGAAS